MKLQPQKLARLEAKTPGLSPKERKEVERTVRRVVDKLMHTPTVQVKKLTGQQGGGNYAMALQRLFDLPLGTPSGLYADTDIPSDLMVEDRVGRLNTALFAIDPATTIDAINGVSINSAANNSTTKNGGQGELNA